MKNGKEKLDNRKHFYTLLKKWEEEDDVHPLNKIHVLRKQSISINNKFTEMLMKMSYEEDHDQA